MRNTAIRHKWNAGCYWPCMRWPASWWCPDFILWGAFVHDVTLEEQRRKELDDARP